MKFLGSLTLAVVLIVVSSVVLTWATFAENRYGTAAAQFGVYGSWWFGWLVGALGVNVLFSALIRLPWKRHQTGFVITHLGILVLLVGCWMTRQWGIDAQLGVVEGHAYHLAFADTRHFAIQIDRPGQKTERIEIPFVSGPFNWRDYGADFLRIPGLKQETLYWFPWRLAHRDVGVLHDANGIRLEVLDYLSDSQVTPGGMGPRGNARHGSYSEAGLLKIRAQGRPTRSADGDADDGDADNPTRSTWTTLALNVLEGQHTGMGLGDRKELPGGERFCHWIARSLAETEAFRESTPEGSLGERGQIILHAGGRRHVLKVDDLSDREEPTPLGQSGVSVMLTSFDEQFLAVTLRLDHPETSTRMILFADIPHFNRQDHANGVFGTYWCDASKYRPGDDDGEAARSMGIHPDRPRIDLLQGTDGNLYYRAWQSPGLVGPKMLDRMREPVEVFSDSSDPVTFVVEQFEPRDAPGGHVVPVGYAKSKRTKTPRARMRLTVGEKVDTFWLEAMPINPLSREPSLEQRRLLFDDDRRVAVTLEPDKINVGFDIYLHEFQRQLDPGTRQAAHYGSLVDFRELAEDESDEMQHERERPPGKILKEKVLVTMNQPVDFSDPRSGRSYRIFQESYRGPQKPGEPFFNEWARPDQRRDHLYVSWLTINHDSGRGLKYLGSLLMTAGIGVMFYMRTYFFRSLQRRDTAEQSTP